MAVVLAVVKSWRVDVAESPGVPVPHVPVTPALPALIIGEPDATVAVASTFRAGLQDLRGNSIRLFVRAEPSAQRAKPGRLNATPPGTRCHALLPGTHALRITP